MKMLLTQLTANPQVSDYKINVHKKESCELFFVKGKLETVRRTDTCDKEVTVYAAHDGAMGDARFFVYPSTTEEELDKLIGNAMQQAALIDNPPYALVEGETGEYAVATNFDSYDASDLAAQIANTVFAANTLEVTSLNAVEIFINRITEMVANSRGLHKKQVRWTAMVEAIPTATEGGESVELYEQVNFSALDLPSLSREIADKLSQAKARHDAKRMEITGAPKVILNSQELMELFWNFAYDLSFASVYSHHNIFKKGDALQSAPQGDKLGITMAASLPGCAESLCFDWDGMTLHERRIVDGGVVTGYYGSSRFGQYLGEEPSGSLPILKLDAGTAEDADFSTGPYLEVMSMSGIQTDFYSDYVGGEIRLAYWHDGETIRPVTGVSISGKLSDVLNHIRFSKDAALMGNFHGPRKAVIEGMNIF